jgi:hypothetical protein
MCYLLRACSQFKWELGSEPTLSFRTFMKFKPVQDHVDPARLTVKKNKKNIYKQKKYIFAYNDKKKYIFFYRQ